MKIVLTEEQFNKMLNETPRKLPKSVKNAINGKMKDIAKDYYGDDYDKPNDRINDKYDLKITDKGKDTRVINNGQFDTGPFALGNGKLSPDTLIINFMSALECPSFNSCPVSQLVCYAVAGEVRLGDIRKKNLAIQDIWTKSYHKGDLGRMFDVAEMYIRMFNEKKDNGEDRYKNKIKYIRYNEAGDFPNMSFVQAAASFSKKMKDEFGVLSMAYTARVGIDFSAPLKGTDIPIDHIIKINASRDDIKRSEDTVKQNFFAVPMNFKEEITNNEKAEYVTFADLDSLKYIPPTEKGTVNQIKSAPYLQYGKWKGGEGLYYICPCSFAIRDKARINAKYFLIGGLIPEYGVVSNPSQELVNSVAEKINDSISRDLTKKLSPTLRKERDNELNKVKSPCGIECAVCHDMEGGILPNGQREMNYNVLTATHGALASNYDEKYTNAKRMGDDSVKYKEGDKKFKDNPKGHFMKFRTAAPIRQELLKSPTEVTIPIKTKKQPIFTEPTNDDSYSEISEQKRMFWEFFDRINKK